MAQCRVAIRELGYLSALFTGALRDGRLAIKGFARDGPRRKWSSCGWFFGEVKEETQ
jgi:hypothetical protein